MAMWPDIDFVEAPHPRLSSHIRITGTSIIEGVEECAFRAYWRTLSPEDKDRRVERLKRDIAQDLDKRARRMCKRGEWEEDLEYDKYDQEESNGCESAEVSRGEGLPSQANSKDGSQFWLF